MRIVLLGFLFSINGFLYSRPIPSDSVTYGDFGKIYLYYQSRQPGSLVLFISGDGGWNKGVVDMGYHLVKQNAMVAGINITRYLNRLKSRKTKCDYPASDFENLSLYIQKHYQFREYLKPILVGYSSGATLAYGIIAQAPFNTFKGAIVLGFCPDIELDKPLCSGSGLKSHAIKPGRSYYLEARHDLPCIFVVLHGLIDQVCDYNSTATYLKEIEKTELVSLPKVGHGFSVEKNWLPQFISSYSKIVTMPDVVKEISPTHENIYISQALDKNLPIIATPPAINDANMPMVFMISGDGGWTDFDQKIASTFSKRGIPTLGLDAQKYFWDRKTPEQSAHDFSVAILEYMEKWHKKSFIFVGYSFGADVLPFIVNKLDAETTGYIDGLVMMSPDELGDFEIHVLDMLSISNPKNKFDVPGEAKKIQKMKVMALFGDEEPEEDLRSFRDIGLIIETIPGSHHYNNDVNAVVAAICKHFCKNQ
jgi:type IV secretory pathway VirJ component